MLFGLHPCVETRQFRDRLLRGLLPSVVRLDLAGASLLRTPPAVDSRARNAIAVDYRRLQGTYRSPFWRDGCRDRRVPALGIAEALDAVEHVGLGFVTCATCFARCPLCLQRGEDALHHRIVPNNFRTARSDSEAFEECRADCILNVGQRIRDSFAIEQPPAFALISSK